MYTTCQRKQLFISKNLCRSFIFFLCWIICYHHYCFVKSSSLKKSHALSTGWSNYSFQSYSNSLFFLSLSPPSLSSSLYVSGAEKVRRGIKFDLVIVIFACRSVAHSLGLWSLIFFYGTMAPSFTLEVIIWLTLWYYPLRFFVWIVTTVSSYCVTLSVCLCVSVIISLISSLY